MSKVLAQVQSVRLPHLADLRTARNQNLVVVWAVFFLFSGQGFRYLLGVGLYAVAAALTLALVLTMFPVKLARLRPPVLLLGYAGISTLSVLWSATITVSLLAVAVMLATAYAALCIVRTVSRPRFFTLLLRGLQVSLGAGLLFEFFVAFVIQRPVRPLTNDLATLANAEAETSRLLWSENNLLAGGPIQGFVGNRNPFGALALLTAVVALVLLLDKRITKWDGYATLGAAALVHALTQSATVTISISQVALVALGGLAIRHIRFDLKKALAWLVLAYCATIAILTLKYRDTIFGLVDRGADMTHRTEIWAQVIELAQQRPEGWGFVSYWPLWAEPYASVSADTWRPITHAHNAFLDAWLQVGVVGALLLVTIVGVTFGSSWRLVERTSKAGSYLPLGWALLTVTLALQGMTESRLLSEGSWFLLVALACSVPPLFKLQPLVAQNNRGWISEESLAELAAIRQRVGAK